MTFRLNPTGGPVAVARLIPVQPKAAQETVSPGGAGARREPQPERMSTVVPSLPILAPRRNQASSTLIALKQ
jgi:hypothetical protein